MAGRPTRRLTIAAAALAIGVGCQSTTRITDSPRSGSEQLLLSSALDATIDAVDFGPIAYATVYLDTTNAEPVSRGYLTYRLRERMADFGIAVQEGRDDADLVVECGTAALGTDSDRHNVGISDSRWFPDITLANHDVQYGVAQIALFAYHRETGQPVWKSGPLRSDAVQRATNVLGIGPVHSGTIDHPANMVPAFDRPGRFKGRRR